MDKPRVFLVVADNSPEMVSALRYTAQRAKAIDGRIALLYVIEPQEIQPLASIQQIITDDEIAVAKAAFRKHEEIAQAATGHKPEFHMRRGDVCDMLIKFINEKPDISVLVLGAHTGPKGPGPLVNYLTSAKGIGKLKIPLVIVPDTVQLDAGQPLV